MIATRRWPSHLRTWLVPVLVMAPVLAIMACTDEPGSISRDSQPFEAIASDEQITALGTEPFWDLRIVPTGQEFEARLATLELPDYARFPVTRFAGNNGLGFSGKHAGAAFHLAVTPGECSDGMSDRTYPYTATVQTGDVTLFGCAYTDSQPFTGDAQ